MLASLKPESRKMMVLVISAVVYIVNDLLGRPVTEDAMMKVLALAGAYIIGQGIADHGAQGAANAAKRAIKDGKNVAAAVHGVLSVSKMVGPTHDDEDEPKPNWEDTAEEDEADKPKELNG